MRVLSEKALLVGATLAANRDEPQDGDLSELRGLAESAGAEVVGPPITQKLQAPNPAHYIGKGKLEELRDAVREHQPDVVLFDDDLTPSQQRNLEQALNLKVVDRATLILDIFAQRARSREGRLQVNLAQYQYLLPRLSNLWAQFSRTGGGIGTRGGPGEQELERERRRIRRRINDLQDEIEDVRRQRRVHRQERAELGFPLVALVGYTNAGKSTLLNALTDARALVIDAPFATLDPTVRKAKLPSGQEILLSDTVGFIRKLPTTLVAAFRATLEELQEADLLLQVIDISDQGAEDRLYWVRRTIAEIGLQDKPVVTALNKTDRLPPDRIIDYSRFTNPAAISAASGHGLDRLLARVQDVLISDYVELKIRLPLSDGRLRELFRRRGSIVRERYTPEAVEIEGKISRRLAGAFRAYER
ncbi:MAG: GTPase HflX [Chloroflexota bacterium]|nr:GTPase HflX [Chloroflexota bacterium]